ncbi:MAG: GH1 family beta-glucosidase [Actinomycetota bacterium]
MRSLPDDFVFGVAASAYQIEGAWDEDGKGESIWDRFVRTPGRILNGDTGEVACDHYHRYPEDVAIMTAAGIPAYSLTTAWTRIIPDGLGSVEPRGIAFYDRLVDELLANGITPYVTLYHWDLPQGLQDRGGWADRDTVDAFVRYADVVSSALGDRVKHWKTHNEPWVASFLGHSDGVFAPGHTDFTEALTAAHHILLSHGRSVPVIRANAPGAEVGIVIDCRPSAPASDAPEDIAAQWHFDGFRNRWFYDPVFGKGYPQDIVDAHRARGRFDTDEPPFVRPGDLDEIATPIDFIGVNYYTAIEVSAGADESEETGVEPGLNPPDGYTEMGWPIVPEALTAFLRRIRDDYGATDIRVTENGASYSDGPGDDGRIHDHRRIDYLHKHLSAVADAIDLGVPVTGYFVWSLLDNFEWALGYSQRFGLVWVDHATGDRIPKDSLAWYSKMIASRAMG